MPLNGVMDQIDVLSGDCVAGLDVARARGGAQCREPIPLHHWIRRLSSRRGRRLRSRFLGSGVVIGIGDEGGQIGHNDPSRRLVGFKVNANRVRACDENAA
jgi:hypothetical protein